MYIDYSSRSLNSCVKYVVNDSIVRELLEISCSALLTGMSPNIQTVGPTRKLIRAILEPAYTTLATILSDMTGNTVNASELSNINMCSQSSIGVVSFTVLRIVNNTKQELTIHMYPSDAKTMLTRRLPLPKTNHPDLPPIQDLVDDTTPI